MWRSEIEHETRPLQIPISITQAVEFHSACKRCMHAYHVITVHDKKEILIWDVLGCLDSACRVDVVEQHVVDVGALAVDLTWFLHAVADVEHVLVTCKVTASWLFAITFHSFLDLFATVVTQQCASGLAGTWGTKLRTPPTPLTFHAT